jgi:ureidoglycolate lyase
VTGPILQPFFLHAPDAAAFAPFGSFIGPSDTAGQRKFYSEHLQAHQPGSDPILHVNHINPVKMPLDVVLLERHPYAAQCFMPLDVARYIVAVMPSDDDGNPIRTQTLAFLMPPTVGVIYHPRVWHLGATVLDRKGHFAVLMWRGGPGNDDEFLTIDPITLTLPLHVGSSTADGTAEPIERRA